MKERDERLRTIKKLIKTQRIESQEALLSYLEKEGYMVTQATLSRDLKLLKVGKISDGWHGYYYTLPDEEQMRESEKNYIMDIQRGFVGLEFSGNIGVIRTLIGHADSLAVALDRISLPEIIGSVAGDDTVIFVIKEGCTQDDVIKTFQAKFPDIEL